MTRPTAPRPAGPPAATPPQAAPPRAAKHRDFKPALARAMPRAVPTPLPLPPPRPPVPAMPLPPPPPPPEPLPPPPPQQHLQALPLPPSPPLEPAIASTPAVVPAVAAPGPLQAPALRPWEAQTNAAFRQRIAEAERSAEHPRNGYGQRNERSGALGRYQFLPIALRDIGWMDAQGRWTAVATERGVTNEASFLANEHAQEAAMSAYLARQEEILERLGMLGAAGTTVVGLNGAPIVLTEGSMVAAAHRRGAGMLRRYLQHRTDTPNAPVPPALRSAFASVEYRLRGFATVTYASERPGDRLMARQGPTAG